MLSRYEETGLAINPELALSKIGILSKFHGKIEFQFGKIEYL